MEQIRHIQTLAVSLLQISAVVAGGWAAVVGAHAKDIDQFWSIASAGCLVVSIGGFALAVGRIRQPGNTKLGDAKTPIYWFFQVGLTAFAFGVVTTAIMAVQVLS